MERLEAGGALCVEHYTMAATWQLYKRLPFCRSGREGGITADKRLGPEDLIVPCVLCSEFREVLKSVLEP